MAKPKVFIDGKDGTTGLQIYDRLGKRDDIELLLISEELRKDDRERKRLINLADIVFLCLPDEAAIQAAEMAENPSTRIIDASTAHRTDPLWTYGFPELSAAQRDAIKNARLVANPGCHASGAVVSLAPLAAAGIIGPRTPVTVFSLTGYSGGGKKMIAQYEASDKGEELFAPRIYGTAQQHKHLPEIVKYSGLEVKPVFCPIVDDYYSGMATTVALISEYLPKKYTAKDIRSVLAEHYDGCRFVKVMPFDESNLYLNSNHLAGTNMMEITVCGGESITITARFDNLGKGASGAAVQNMNIMLGLPEETSLL